MKVVVAVSGGVDSVVLLDMLAKKGKYELIVAHFDHGMRRGSAADARFVEKLAEKYDLKFEMQRAELGGASEEIARNSRYEFLFEMARKHQARLATAHHMDDAVETIVLNIQRGTRWRGLAGMSDERIWRPLTKRTKSELIEYAVGERLEWVEDETNSQTIYARNKIRKKLAQLPCAQKLKVYELWQKQLEVRQEIDKEISREISGEIEQGHFPIFSRYFMIMQDETVARELAYEYILRNYQISLLASQLDYMILAIKTGRQNTKWQIGQSVTIELTRREWRVQMAER